MLCFILALPYYTSQGFLYTLTFGADIAIIIRYYCGGTGSGNGKAMAAKKERETKVRMACWNCPRYSRTERRCADGKSNPRKKADSVMVAEVLGLRALCHYNPYRDPLAARMYFPNTALGLDSVPPKRPRQGKYGTLTLPAETPGENTC